MKDKYWIILGFILGNIPTIIYILVNYIKHKYELNKIKGDIK